MYVKCLCIRFENNYVFTVCTLTLICHQQADIIILIGECSLSLMATSMLNDYVLLWICCLPLFCFRVSAFTLLLYTWQLELVTERGLAATAYDHVAGLAHSKFMELLGTVTNLLTGKKVMAAMVMRMGDGDIGKVVSLGTGV